MVGTAAEEAAAPVRRRFAGTLLSASAVWLAATALGGGTLARTAGTDHAVVAIISAALLAVTVLAGALVADVPRPGAAAVRRRSARTTHRIGRGTVHRSG